MRIKDGFVLREVAGQAVVIATGEAARGFQGMVRLNDTGRIVWEGLAAGMSEPDIVERLVTEFGADEAQAARDVEALVAQMAAEGFLA